MTELYQHVVHHPSIRACVDDWHARIAQERTEARQRIETAQTAAQAGVLSPADAARELVYARHDLNIAQNAKVIAMDIIDGAVPMETYRFPERCLLLFGAEAKACRRRRSSWPTTSCTSANSARCAPSTPVRRPP